MSIFTVTVLPPGTTTFFETDQDGNYTGTNIVIPWSRPDDPSPPPITIAPTFTKQPAPDTSTPVPPGSPGTRVFQETVKEGMRLTGGDLEIYSTGPVSPTQAEGWTNSAAAIGADGSVASTDGASGDDLILSGFNFNIPGGAVITGLKVIVKRSKI